MSQSYGKTRWKRFALVMVPGIAATAAIGVSIANNALAASFAVSGSQFVVTAQDLDGKNFAQFGSIDTNSPDPTKQKPTQVHPVAISAFDSADIQGLCQSVRQDLPFGLGTVTMQLKAAQDPNGPKVHADNLLIDLDSLSADATFDNINIGQDASTVAGNTKGPAGGFAQAAPHAHLTNVKQTAWATSAGTFKLPGLKLNIVGGDQPCGG